MEPSTKTCRRCQQETPLSEFHKRKVSKDGLQPLCKQCSKEVRNQTYELNKARPQHIINALHTRLVKLCRKCNANKPLSEFGEKKRNKDGLQFYCNRCNCKSAVIRYKHYQATRTELADEAPIFVKYCRRCDTEKLVSAFYKYVPNICNRDGLSTYCSECMRVDASNNYAKNRERNLAAQKRYYENNKDLCVARSAAWRNDNKDTYKERKKVYAAANPEKSVAYTAKRRARKMAAHGSYTGNDVKQLMILQRGKCPVCKKDIRKKYNVDHVVALARGGSNDKSNIQLLCPTCNNQKHAKDPIAFMRERGFLL